MRITVIGQKSEHHAIDLLLYLERFGGASIGGELVSVLDYLRIVDKSLRNLASYVSHAASRCDLGLCRAMSDNWIPRARSKAFGT
jgi:hypothetical protein